MAAINDISSVLLKCIYMLVYIGLQGNKNFHPFPGVPRNVLYHDFPQCNYLFFLIKLVQAYCAQINYLFFMCVPSCVVRLMISVANKPADAVSL